MSGFFFLVLFLVAGVLGLVGALRFYGLLPGREPPPGAGPTREDLHRLQDALSSLDARLDRLEDQQRFLERLLEERPEPPALPAPQDPAAADAPERGAESILFDVEPDESRGGG